MHGQAAFPSGAISYAAARVARIVLRREPSGVEVLAWTSMVATQANPARGRAELALFLLDLPELAGLGLEERTIRAYNAVMQRYGAPPPRELPLWLRRMKELGLSLQELVRGAFVKLAESGNREEPCGAPVAAGLPFFVVRDSGGLPQVFAVGTNGHLHLFRHTAAGHWTQTDLSAALAFDGVHEVQCLDVRQAGNGDVAVVLAVAQRGGNGASTLYAAAGLSRNMDEREWIRAIGAMVPGRRGLPDGACVDRLGFVPLLAGAPPIVVLSAKAGERDESWCFNAATPGSPAFPLRLQSGLEQVNEFAVGSYRLPGSWKLARDGGAQSLKFSSFPDQFGWAVNVEYKGLPARSSSFLLAQGGEPNVPDVFVAGQGIVVYRGGHGVPQVVARVANVKLVWSDRDASGEHLAYMDGAGGLWLLSRRAGAPWGRPQAIADMLVATALCGDPHTSGVHAVGVTPGGALMWMKLDVDGKVIGCEEITQSAVSELDAAAELARFGTAA